MEKPIVFFDGVCNLCNGFISFLVGIDKDEKFHLSSLQGETAKKYLDKDDIDQMKSIVVWDKGKLYKKSEAVLHIFLVTGGIWTCVSWFRFFPSVLTNIAYDFIAKNRYLFFGKKESCRIPTPEERKRFLV
jgi:predicted DCC family thiol-disulfide oxidoreductase YuxK